VDALVIAYVLAMFIRTYVVELYKIPTGSMTPTLVGDDQAVEMDYDGNGEEDLVLSFGSRDSSQAFRYVAKVFLRENGEFARQVWVDAPPMDLRRQLMLRSRARHDMILVNKFCYWFSPPKRGDILVFKVPNRPELDALDDPTRSNPWDPTMPIFIKRCVGVPGDTIRIDTPRYETLAPGDPGYVGVEGPREISIESGPAKVNGSVLSSPPVFTHISHFPYGFNPFHLTSDPEEFSVPPDGFFMMGDNSADSKDSRAWGPVPRERIKGKAIFRYWPLRTISFLE